MPKIVVPVPETLNSVTRPVVLEITRQLMKDLGIPFKTPVFFPGDTEQAAQPGSLITPSDDVNTFPFFDRLQVTVDEVFDQDRILSMAVYRPENLFIFRDDRIEVGIKPAYSSADMTINFTYRAQDKTTAMRFRDDMRTRIAMGRDEQIHGVSYHYLVPPAMLVILEEIHRMREAVAGYGEDWDTYFKANVTQRASLITNLAGEQGAWGISERQMRIVGYWDFEGAPDIGSKDDELDTWTVTFAYKFKFDKPVACVMFYPLMVHNQLIKYRPSEKDKVDTPDAHQRSYTLSSGAFANFESGRTKSALSEGLDVPSFDDFIPASVPTPTKRIVTALTSVDPTQPKFLMNMATDLGDFYFHPAIIKFMRGEVAFMTKRYQSILQLNLYRNINLQAWEALQITPDLDVVSTNELGLRDYWHIRLSAVTDLRLLPPAAIDRLRQNGEAFQLLVQHIAPWLGEGVPKILAGDYVSKVEADKIIDAINRDVLSRGNNQEGYQFNTVGTLFLIANKRSE